jgi:hypothetical protein
MGESKQKEEYSAIFEVNCQNPTCPCSIFHLEFCEKEEKESFIECYLDYKKKQIEFIQINDLS